MYSWIDRNDYDIVEIFSLSLYIYPSVRRVYTYFNRFITKCQ